MAGEWLKFDCTLPEKPEVLAITVAMGWDDPDLTVGKLMRVFRWFDQHTIDGNARGVTAALLDRLIGVAGFVQAMCEVGWIVVSADGLSLHSFEKHNGATAKSRAQTAKRVANHRANASETPATKPRNVRSVTEALAREEKRREEEIPPQPPKGGALRFAEFWSSWPSSERKGGRAKCEEAWRRGRFDAEADVILAHVAAMGASETWRKDGGAFIPAPLVYLNGRRWDGADLGANERPSVFAGAV